MGRLGGTLSSRLLRGGGYALYLVLAILAGLEIGCRLFLPQALVRDPTGLFIPDDEIGWRHQPDFRTRSSWQGSEVDVCTDALGDRVSCSAGPRAVCSQRVLVIGDSFVDAIGLAYEDTVWHRIEQDTRACMEIAGVGGYGPSQYLRTAQERIPPSSRRFDLVILSLYVGNDFDVGAAQMPRSELVARRPLRLLPRELSISSLRDWLYPLNQILEARSHAWVLLRNTALLYESERQVHDVLRLSRLTPEILEGSLATIRRLAEEVRRAGVPLLVTVIPVWKQVLDPDGSALLRAVPSVRGDLDMDLPQRRILPRLREIPGIRLIDLLPALRARATRDYWGRTDLHFSARGHAAWFELMREEIRELLAEPES